MRVRGIRNLLELPLVTAQQVHMGDISDALLDLSEQRVIKLVIDWVMDNRQISGSDMDLPYSQVATFDPHQVVVSDEIAETAGLDLLNYDDEGLVSAQRLLLDRDVVTTSGDRLGSLVDLYFDEEDGAILGFEVSRLDLGAEEVRTRMLAPTTDMEFKDGAIVIPDKILTITLASAEGLSRVEGEDQETSDYVYESEGRSARTQEPDSDEELTDPNLFPEGHPSGIAAETRDNLFG
ncbi:MAG TPA: PRC-barrel domain-containing protein [Pantanalinema sp.]